MTKPTANYTDGQKNKEKAEEDGVSFPERTLLFLAFADTLQTTRGIKLVIDILFLHGIISLKILKLPPQSSKPHYKLQIRMKLSTFYFSNRG